MINSLSEERERELAEHVAEVRERGVDLEAVETIEMPRGQWLLLVENVDVAAFDVTTREIEVEPMSEGATPGCSCPACDAFDVEVRGRLIDLMRLNIAMADATWPSVEEEPSAEVLTAYEDFWPAIASLCEDEL